MNLFNWRRLNCCFKLFCWLYNIFLSQFSQNLDDDMKWKTCVIGRVEWEREREYSSQTVGVASMHFQFLTRRRPRQATSPEIQKFRSQQHNNSSQIIGKYIHTISMTHIKRSSEFMLSTSTHVSAVATLFSRNELFVSDIRDNIQRLKFIGKTLYTTIFFIIFSISISRVHHVQRESFMNMEKFQYFSNIRWAVLLGYAVERERFERGWEKKCNNNIKFNLNL